MRTVNESVAKAMDCDSIELVQYLPYILQDFYEMGSLSKSILKIVKEQNAKDYINVLDLGCGKGAVLCAIAENINSSCLGIDAVPDFIEVANTVKKKKGLKNCEFKVGDIQQRENISGKYDFIILGSIGPVFGNYTDTMEYLKPLLNDEGMIILDDGYIEEDKQHNIVIKKDDLIKEIEVAGMEIKKEYMGEEVRDEAEFEDQLKKIKRRCNELIEKYPEKVQLFRDYIMKQEKEYQSLENDIICSTMVIARKV